MHNRTNWPEVRAAYVEGIVTDGVRSWPTAEEVCAMFGASISTLKKRSMTEEWFDLRNKFRTEVELSRRSKTAAALASEGLELDACAHKAAALLVDQVLKHIEAARVAGELLSPGVAKTLSGALTSALQAGHLAQGTPTEISDQTVKTTQLDASESSEALKLLSDDELDALTRGRTAFDRARAQVGAAKSQTR